MAFDLKKALGAGIEGIDQSVQGMPLLNIVQKGSPEFDETHKEYAEKRIPDCKVGDIFASRGRKILPQPVLVIPIATASIYTEWKPKSGGSKGGFVGNQPLSIVGSRNYRKGAANTPDANKEWLGQNELKFTIYMSLLYKVGDTWEKGMIAFASTQLKRARKWSRDILSVRYPDMPDQQPPIFAAQWKLETENDSNDKGGWKAWKITLDRVLSPEADGQLMEQAFTEHGVEQPRLNAGAPAPAALPEGKDTDVPY